MKSNSTLLAFIAVAILLVAGGIPSPAQVKIPAKSASSLNNDDPNNPKVTTNESQAAVAAPSSPSNAVATTVTAVQRVPTPTQEINPAKLRRLAELRRQLDIADAATQAKITLQTDTLFLESEPETLDELALPTLKKIVDYIRLNDKKDVTLRSFFAPDEERGKSRAWNRSLTLIEWMTEEGGLDPDEFKATQPLPVVKATPEPFATEIGDTDFVNRTEFVLE
ncbi:MAG: hypothetical protein AAGC68_05185 [Verrucomicrobiota bacterium]